MTPIRIGHLYGNLLNTYGDNGNLLMLQYGLKKRGLDFTVEVNSLEESFKANQYDLIFFGGGQDFEQKVVSDHIQTKKDELEKYIESNGVLLAICGGYQLLGEYYLSAKGDRIEGTHLLNLYTLNQVNSRFVGDVEIFSDEFNETYYGYENHNGRTFIKDPVKPLGRVIKGYGNNNEDKTEGARYKNVFCSYFHGPLLVRNPHLVDRIIDKVLEQRNQSTEKGTKLKQIIDPTSV